MARSTNNNEREKYWEAHLLNQKSSNFSQKQYCINNKISLSTFGYWKRKLETSRKNDIQFFPVALPIPQKAEPTLLNSEANSAGVQLITNQGRYRIEFDNDFSPVALNKVLSVLETL